MSSETSTEVCTNISTENSSVMTATSNENTQICQNDQNGQKDNDEKIDLPNISDNIKFGEDDEENKDNNQDEQEESMQDMSRYTVVDADHLDEDEPLRGQEYCIFSFMSPEGIMNCNVRAVKFRGAYSSIEKAQEAAKKLEEKDKYFKIFIGESGKWLDFDPPASRVEREMSSNPDHQKILDAQAKQRMKKINDLAGKHKEMIDKKDGGKKERIEEIKKTGAANDAVEKQRSKKQEKLEKEKEKQETIAQNSREQTHKNMLDRMRKKLAEKQNKTKVEKMAQEERAQAGRVLEEESTNINTNDASALDDKIRVVSKAANELEDKKAQLEAADRNIENIKKFMAKRKQTTNN